MKSQQPKTYLDELSRKQFTLDWHKELGWKENPFTQQCLEPIEYFITGHEEERQKLNYFVIQHQPFGTISADKGCGASTMALWLRDELQKYKRRTSVVYIPLTGVGSIDFLHRIITSTLGVGEKALINSYFRMGGNSLQKSIGKKLKWGWLSKESFYAQIAAKKYTSLDAIRGFLAEKLKDRPIVIILDQTEHMHKQHAQILQSFFFAHLPVQVVAVGTKESIARSPLKLLQKKDALRINLQKLTPHEMRDLIAKRILYFGGENISPLNDAILKKFYEKSEKNPRQILAMCQEHCVKAALESMKQKQIAKQQENAIAAGKEPVKAKEPAHPFSNEKVLEEIAMETVQPEEPVHKPSFEIPSDILEQIEKEEAEAKKEAKKKEKKDTTVI